MPPDLCSLPLTELSRLLAQGLTTSRAIVDACLARIDALDSKLHAFIDVYHAEARERADAADRERAGGQSRGPLHGLPIALKDLLHIDGRQTTAGSKCWLGRISRETATSVERVVAAGMIPLGKTHLVEFAFGGWGRNEPMGAPWNPWDLAVHRVAGGSSSGSAVAIAAALAPIAIGSDTGGSIRIPAALCGITGFKPTYGLVSLHGVVPLSPTFDSLGPLGRSVEDCTLLLAALAGPDPRDPATAEAPRIDFAATLAGEADLRGMRITALAPEQFPEDILPEVVAARDAAIVVLRAGGAEVDEAALPLDLEAMKAGVGLVLAAESYAFHRAYIEDPALPIDPWVRRRMLAGKDISDIDLLHELRAMRFTRSQFEQWMSGRDALLTPTVPITALPIADVDEATMPLATFTRAVNYLGACGVSLPAGFSAAGLPIGVQLVGAPFADATLARIGRAFQRATDWHLRRPAVDEAAR